jgi:hypothetical protein
MGRHTVELKSVLRQMNELGLGDSLLHNFGLEYRRPAFARFINGLGIFAAGFLVGAGVGLLFAPMRGDELRGKARQNIDEWRSRIMERGAEVSGAVSERAEARVRHSPPTTP